MELTVELAKRGHCTSKGTIASGKAVCECGWTAADFETPEARKAGRKVHLNEVLVIRLQAQAIEKGA